MAPTLGLHSAVFWNCLWKENAEFWWSLWTCGCPVVSFYFNIALYHLCSSPYTVCEFTWRIILSTRRFFLNLYMCFKNPKFDPDKDNASVEYSVFSDFRYCDVRIKMAAPMDLMFTCMLWAPTMNIAILRGALDIYWHCKVYIFMRLTVDNIFGINYLFPFELSIFVSGLNVACCMLNECDISMSVYVC